MQITLNIWVALSTCGFVIGFFMAILFFLFRKRYSKHIQNITVALFILSMMLLNEIAEESNIVDALPFLIGMTTTVDLLLWPFIIFYIQFIIGDRDQYHWKDCAYFIPFIVGFLWQSHFTFLPGEQKLDYYSNGIPVDMALFVGYKFLFTIIFILFILGSLSRGLQQYRRIFPKNKKALFVNRVRRIFVVLAISISLLYLLFFNNYFDWIPLGDSDRIGSLFISGMFLFFGIVVFRNPRLFQEDQYSKAVKGFFDDTELDYEQKLLQYFEQDKPYLNEKLTVKDVAAKVNLSSQQLSFLINRQLGVSFLEFVNSYRVKEVMSRIKAGEHLQKTLLGVALDSGFSGKASFNRIFKEYTGLTPSAFSNQPEN